MLRAGLIIPSSNRMVEQEVVGAFPRGVQPHITRLRMTGPHRGPLAQLLPRIEEAATALVDAKCEVVTFHCTANAMQEGVEGEARILGAIARAGAAHATSTATAVRRAMQSLRARRIVLLTPYSQAVTDHEAEFLHEAGLEVVQAKGFALAGSDAYCSTPASFWRERGVEAARADADVYFLSCANISTFPIIAELESRLDRPVVSSNQMILWDALAQLGWREPGGGPGRLFATLTERQAAAHQAV